MISCSRTVWENGRASNRADINKKYANLNLFGFVYEYDKLMRKNLLTRSKKNRIMIPTQVDSSALTFTYDIIQKNVWYNKNKLRV